MLQSRRGFLIGVAGLLTAAFVSDARSIIRRTGRPLLASPSQVAQTLHWYEVADDGYRLTLGEWTTVPPPAPTWREFFVSEGIAHQTEDEAYEAWSHYAIWPEDYDKPVDERYWEDRFECEDGPAAKAYRLLSGIDLGPGARRAGEVTSEVTLGVVIQTARTHRPPSSPRRKLTKAIATSAWCRLSRRVCFVAHDVPPASIAFSGSW